MISRASFNRSAYVHRLSSLFLSLSLSCKQTMTTCDYLLIKLSFAFEDKISPTRPRWILSSSSRLTRSGIYIYRDGYLPFFSFVLVYKKQRETILSRVYIYVLSIM